MKIARDQSRETRLFYSLVWPHAPTVLRAARLLTRDSAEADDVAQETLIKAFNAIDSFQQGTNMHAWLMTIMRRTRIDRLRSESSHARNIAFDQLGAEPASEPEAREAGLEETEWETPEDLLEQFSDQQIIDVLHALPEEIRWTLLLAEIQGMSHEESAAVLGVPVGTVKSRAFRGRAMLRESLLPIAREMRFVK